MTRRQSFTVGIAALVCGVLALAGSMYAAEPVRGGRLVQLLPGEPGNLNPSLSTDQYMFSVAGAIFNNLVQFDKQLNPIPDLAESWRISPDGLTYTFKLRDAKWHDGKPVTSEDVKFTFEEITTKHHPRGTVFGKSIERIETPDVRTVVFRLKEVSPAFIFINRLGNGGAILPKHVYAGSDPKQNPANTRPIGSGAYRFKEWVKGSHIIVERNPQYFKPGKPYLDSVVFKIVPDATGRVLALEQGEGDFLSIYGAPMAEIPRLRRTKGVVVTTEGNEATAVLTLAKFNLRHESFKQLKVRQALAHAVNQKLVGERAHYGVGRASVGPIHSDLAWAYTDDVPKYPYDLARANALLDEAGYRRKPDGVRFRVNVAYNTKQPEIAKTAEIMRDTWNAVGVAVTLQPLDFAGSNKVEADWSYDVHIGQYSCGPDPAVGVARLYLTSNIKNAPGVNTMGYSNPHVDDLFARAAKELDQKKRAALYRDIQKVLAKDVPAVFVWDWGLPVVYRDEWTNLVPVTFVQDQHLEEVHRTRR